MHKTIKSRPSSKPSERFQCQFLNCPHKSERVFTNSPMWFIASTTLLLVLAVMETVTKKSCHSKWSVCWGNITSQNFLIFQEWCLKFWRGKNQEPTMAEKWRKQNWSRLKSNFLYCLCQMKFSYILSPF